MERTSEGRRIRELYRLHTGCTCWIYNADTTPTNRWTTRAAANCPYHGLAAPPTEASEGDPE